MAIDKIQVNSTEVSDDANTSTGAFDIPAGTTAQRPGSPTTGNFRFNTDTQSGEMYDGNAWGKVSPLIPTLSSVTGSIMNGLAKDISLVGTEFLSSNLIVNFTPSGGSTTSVTIQPTTNTSASVAVPSAIQSVSVGTVVSITVTNSDSRTSGAVTTTVLAAPSGGTISTSGNFRIHTFNTSDNFVAPLGMDVEYLIIAGGAGGGGYYYAGGGGAGGYRTNVSGQSSGGGGSAETSMTLTAATYPVVVGAGGAARQSVASDQDTGHDGIDSSFNSITSLGGGGGASSSGGGNTPNSGGSGGGAAGVTASSGGSGTANQGFAGGGSSGISNQYGAGGGGGAGAAGTAGYSGVPGTGGDGVSSNITGTAVTRAGGGGGGTGAHGASGTQGFGGSGGGGIGGVYNADGNVSARAPTDATANTGSGGGGASHIGSTPASGTSGAGGKGLVVIRYDLTTL